MPFLIYFVIALVALGTVLIELDWLTRPKLEPKAAMQTAGTAAPAPKRAQVDGPNAELSPVYTTAPRVVGTDVGTMPAVVTSGPAQPAADTTEVSASRATTGSGGDAVANNAAPAPQPATMAPLSPQPFPTPSATLQPAVAAEPATTPPAAQTVTAAPATTLQTANRCDVSACAGLYQSFRASDCSYQPFEGARKLCVASGGAQRAATETREPKSDLAKADLATRKRSKDAELREVERVVKRITPNHVAEIDDDAEPGPAYERPSRVIIMRGPRW